MTNEECSGVLLWTDDLKAKLAQAEATITEQSATIALLRDSLRRAEELSIDTVAKECVLCDSYLKDDGTYHHQKCCPFAALSALPEQAALHVALDTKYRAAVDEIAQSDECTSQQVVERALRLYQLERKGLAKVEMVQIGPGKADGAALGAAEGEQ